jgi:hypothetical protein
VYRRVELYVNRTTLPKGWNGIQRFVKLRRWGKRNNKEFHEVSFYALSNPINSALVAASAIQGHWGIENNLHWTKDVLLQEDYMTPHDKNMVSILVQLNNLALNTVRINGLRPVKDTFAKFANKVNELYKLFVNFDKS